MYVNPGPVSSNDRLFTIPFRLSLAFYNPTDLQRFGRTPWISVNSKHSAKLKLVGVGQAWISCQVKIPFAVKQKVKPKDNKDENILKTTDVYWLLYKWVTSIYNLEICSQWYNTENVFNVQSIEFCVVMKSLFLFSSHPLHPEFQDKELPKNRKWHIPLGASAHYKKI